MVYKPLMTKQVFDLLKVASEFNRSDIGTKPLKQPRFEQLRHMTGIRSIKPGSDDFVCVVHAVESNSEYGSAQSDHSVESDGVADALAGQMQGLSLERSQARCQAKTKKGVQCKRPAMRTGEYKGQFCYQHAPKPRTTSSSVKSPSAKSGSESGHDSDLDREFLRESSASSDSEEQDYQHCDSWYTNY